MVDHLTLNTVLNVVWYATNISFQYGQEQFHSIFTLFAPFGIPIYRYCFQTTPRYNFTLMQWIIYALAYCSLLLLTRDTVEILTLGKPFLDDILTLARITLAVFWFSIIRHGLVGSIRNIWQSVFWTCIFILQSLAEKLDHSVVVRSGRWIAALLRRASMPLDDLIFIMLGQATYNSMNMAWYRLKNGLDVMIRRAFFTWRGRVLPVAICIAIFAWSQSDYRLWLTGSLLEVMGRWRGVLTQSIALARSPCTALSSYIKSSSSSYGISPMAPVGLACFLLTVALGPFYWRRYALPAAIVFASDWTRFVTVTSAQWIYRRGQTLVHDRTHRLAPFVLSSLVLASVAAGVGYMFYATLLPSSGLNPDAILQLGSPADYNGYTNVQVISQDVHTEARSWFMGVVANTALVPFEQATKAYHVLACPSAVLMYLARYESPITLIWHALKKYFHHAIAAVYSPAEKSVIEVEFYEYEEVMTEAVKVGQVCYNEDEIELPCWYDPEASEEAYIIDLVFNGVRRLAEFLGMV